MNKSTKQKERKVILKMAATRKPKTEPQVTSKPDAPVCQHQWMTIMGDDPYHHKVICVKCGKEKTDGE
jgi:hypothetical protein